jgi:hypothetical protein
MNSTKATLLIWVKKKKKYYTKSEDNVSFKTLYKESINVVT